jgi:hypothetical protein
LALSINLPKTKEVKMQDRRLEKIQKEIEEIKQELQGIGEIRPGGLSKQIYYRNDKKCPYYQISYTYYTYRMKSHTEYVRNEFVFELREQIKNYRRFKRLTNRWVDLAIKHAKLKMKIKVKSMINSR